RLVYSDYLQEQGDPRGEFIHVQCRLARLPPDHPERTRLQVRERQLLDAHGREWEHCLGSLGIRPVFYRGFVEGLTLDAADFLERGEQLVRATPLRQVWLQRASGLVDRLAASPLLARLNDLNL